MKFWQNKNYLKHYGYNNIFFYKSSTVTKLYKNKQLTIFKKQNGLLKVLFVFFVFFYFNEIEAKKNVWTQEKISSNNKKNYSLQKHHLRMKNTEEFLPTIYREESNFDLTTNLWPLASNSGKTKLFRKKSFFVSAEVPIHILFPLPTKEGPQELNPFGITIALTKPVVDIAIEEVYCRQLVPLNSLNIHFEDSKLSDAHGPNVAINQLVDNRLDCIIG